MQKRRKNTDLTFEFIEQLYKIGGKIQIKTLRRSKKNIHPRKFLLLLEIPIATTNEIIENNEKIKELKQRTLYDGTIVEIKQTNEKFYTFTFGIIVNKKNKIIFFLNKLSKVSKFLKKELEKKEEENNE